ncbi:DDE-domain-containing [Pyrrhoderma noxium]|uniref:DDE-domain-containing n=1 Tax=Pyrrhoderma noxium TaxID=2282107 RepID=A0A286UU89_9AGAM|nr:DDE-domain-containing [Pyrrhoderma noxium]
MREELTKRADETPMSLSRKRPHIVTNPVIELALIKWQRYMEFEQKEIVTGPILVAKREYFENEFNVPKEKWLLGSGWYSPEDRFNLDETGLFAFAPPDCGLASQQMHEKKKDKFRLTLVFAYNATGTEKEEILFIGYSKKPRCFGKISPIAQGFQYRNNKSAWMTSYLFEEYLKTWDMKLRRNSRHIILLVDNFQGHVVATPLTNIHLEFFAPNMTSFIQPLDAGIIRCFKALYQKAFCERTIDQDIAGERDIYKITLLEAILMAQKAWKGVSMTTIENCWKHTQMSAMTSASTCISQ